MVGTVKKSIDTVVFTWFSRKVRHVCEGGFRRRTMYLLTLVSPTSMPSLRSSPCMRGAPHSGFSRLILPISLRISFVEEEQERSYFARTSDESITRAFIASRPLLIALLLSRP